MLTLVPVSEFTWPIYNTLRPISAIVLQHVILKPDYEVYSMSSKIMEQALNSKFKIDPATALPEAFKKFSKVFS